MTLPGRLETAILSDAHRGAKMMALWALLLFLCVSYGLVGSPLNQPSLIGALQNASAHEGMPLSFAFTHLRPAPASTGMPLEIDTAAGWLPVAEPLPEGLAPNQTVSVAGVLRGDGAFVAQAVMTHPNRGGKVWVSLATLIALTLAVLWRGIPVLLAARRGSAGGAHPPIAGAGQSR